jgi:hypothetical protein
MSQAVEGKLVISICAGVTIAQLRSWVPASTKIVRAMPNTPCKVSYHHNLRPFAYRPAVTRVIVSVEIQADTPSPAPRADPRRNDRRVPS